MSGSIVRALFLLLMLTSVACAKPAPKIDDDTRFIQKLKQALADHTEIFADENRLARKICGWHADTIKECAEVIPRLPVLAPLPK
jgi:hypothetical protein